MRTWAFITAQAAALTIGFASLGVTPAVADGPSAPESGRGAGSGSRVAAPVSLPVDACGGAVAIGGSAKGGCPPGAADRGGGGPATSGERGVGSGNQVIAPVYAPVNVCGNAVALFGEAEAHCSAGASAEQGAPGTTAGRGGVLSGNQVHAPVSAPVNICGNAVAILGRAVATCEGGAQVRHGAGQVTSGESGVIAGNQIGVPVSAPVNVCGNAVGRAMAACRGATTVRDGGQSTRGDSGAVAGNQLGTPASVPVSLCGNAAGAPREAGAFCRDGAHVRGSGGPRTSGEGGAASGNQLAGPASVPSSICGNAGTVGDHGAAACQGGPVASYGPETSTAGDGGAGSRNQGRFPVTAPASVCGNAGAAGGHSEPVCEDGPGAGPPYGDARE